ncbi:M20/M25/M40 family metallo-hydrolase [Sphingomonas colocasiae]|uniref:M20/M25/M40 family metallo-hydrolase n=1 Tax=Sphingomonas colocasiae TaxID=1848973 RepID=A0ABS7PWV6_9SPHN|nr:M20/M25/M40 family metallo-hydrolase [Sphingomonas colocasiae]MBY8825693.1 M20/M25/M40 family metallo-hydrolase [Sphingomonas colocasiae]
MSMIRRLPLSIAVLVAAPAFAAPVKADPVRQYRIAHEWEIVRELADFVAIPNAGRTAAEMEPNVRALDAMLRRRGFTVTRIQTDGGKPSIIARLDVAGARRTLGFYAHFDGQPVSQPDWRTPPFEPVLRAGAAVDAPVIDLAGKPVALPPEARLYGRSASDDKAPIVAILRAMDALRAGGQAPAANVILFLDGDEESGSPDIAAQLRDHAGALKADLWILCDGPVHSSGAQQVILGARGVASLELTAYGPARGLHSGHYGNWVPNPALALARLLAAMRDEDGVVTIPGFEDGVKLADAEEQRLLDALPAVEDGLRRDLRIGRTLGSPRLMDGVIRPALNIRGISAGAVGDKAANVIPTRAMASIDMRLVPGQVPDHVRAVTERFFRDQGWFVTAREPDAETLLSHVKVLRAEWGPGYPGYRAAASAPGTQAVIRAVTRALGKPPLVTPMLGGSIPMSVIADGLATPAVLLPTVNADNAQHAANENLRLRNLWDGIDMFAAILRDFDGGGR